ncbi:MAG: hypothetical protein JWR42_1767 [Marmoricola sp.]|nr:hypothetical protein [Marmoricola sp.]
MTGTAKRLAVRFVKPVVSEQVWVKLKRSEVQTAPVSPPPPPPPPPPTLTELGLEHGTDKATAHRYTQHYERHLGHLRRRKFNLLEIGIGGYSRDGQGGNSLRMWKAYFRRARIVGLDIRDKSFVREPRIRTVRGSQVDEGLLHRIHERYGPFEVVIDDGSHRPEHIRETFRVMFPLLSETGVYVIEDTQTSYWPEWGGSEDRSDPTTTMALVKDLIDGLNHEEYLQEDYEPTYSDRFVVAVHCYHNLVVVEKGVNDEGSNKRLILKERYGYDATPDPTP